MQKGGTVQWSPHCTATEAPRKHHRGFMKAWTYQGVQIIPPWRHRGPAMDRPWFDHGHTTKPLKGPSTIVSHHGSNNEQWTNQPQRPNTAPWNYHGDSNDQPLTPHGGNNDALWFAIEAAWPHHGQALEAPGGYHGSAVYAPSTAQGGTKDMPWRHHGRSMALLWWVHDAPTVGPWCVRGSSMWVRNRTMGRLLCLSCGTMVDLWRVHGGSTGPWCLHWPCMMSQRRVGPWWIHGATMVCPCFPMGAWWANGVCMVRSEGKLCLRSGSPLLVGSMVI